MPVRSQSTRFVLTCAIGGCPGFSSRTPIACTAGMPPEISRMAVAILMASARSSVRRLMLNAMSGLRAPTATAPPRGWSRAGPKSGARIGFVADLVAQRLVLAATNVGQPPSLGTQGGLAVEVDRQVEA